MCPMKEVRFLSHAFWKIIDEIHPKKLLPSVQKKRQKGKTEKSLSQSFLGYRQRRNNTIGTMIIKKSKNENV